MVDVLTSDQRRLNMSRIRAKNTKPEIVIRKGLHALGFRYRLHRQDLPGTPDLVFPSKNAVIFVHGCFWHGHDCSLFHLPKTGTEFWRTKIERNRARDRLVLADLRELGWRTLVVWECTLKGQHKIRLPLLMAQCAKFLEKYNLTGQELPNSTGGR